MDPPTAALFAARCSSFRRRFVAVVVHPSSSTPDARSPSAAPVARLPSAPSAPGRRGAVRPSASAAARPVRPPALLRPFILVSACRGGPSSSLRQSRRPSSAAVRSVAPPVVVRPPVVDVLLLPAWVFFLASRCGLCSADRGCGCSCAALFCSAHI